ncbi:bifunctional DNA-formamidopyrimidine glycosylase/DNA-(apurinic or apyrimidinic site) lyase [Georgenia sp. Z1491]|uniref:bifunctional DNA-formamidopyrimidine glycosylase/DNA-(apurinic or apyrimidinic site) lyase n=1 Tax=Georgenia sp. Z1491 TaxID=3416707 RepID=UPI003CF371E8
MPELPEVEVVRAGLVPALVGREIADVEVRHPRAVRNTAGGSAAFAALRGREVVGVVRRGKYLWLLLDDGKDALLAHLGMSGQMLVQRPGTSLEPGPHVRARLVADDGGEVWFVDQRTFGYVDLTPTVATPDGGPGGRGSPARVLPRPVAHVARDLLDPDLDMASLVARTRRRRTEVKRALLDQTLVSGVGNIYADEALWRARLHGTRATDALPPARLRELYTAAGDVMAEALAQGGTSFDALYVNVAGTPGYFARSLHAYGRAGEPCDRCGTLLRIEPFMNRRSVSCPRCQRRAPQRSG